MTAKNTSTPAPAPAAPIDLNERLVAALELQAAAAARQAEVNAAQASVQERLEANQPRKKISVADIQAREEKGRWNKGYFKYPVEQNGYEASPGGLSDDTLKRCASVAPGRYLNDIVTVVRTGKDKAQKVHLFYANETMDARMALKDHFSSFSDLFVKIHAEMKARGIAPVE